jgi:hypothetical protein
MDVVSYGKWELSATADVVSYGKTYRSFLH